MNKTISFNEFNGIISTLTLDKYAFVIDDIQVTPVVDDGEIRFKFNNVVCATARHDEGFLVEGNEIVLPGDKRVCVFESYVPFGGDEDDRKPFREVEHCLEDARFMMYSILVDVDVKTVQGGPEYTFLLPSGIKARNMKSDYLAHIGPDSEVYCNNRGWMAWASGKGWGSEPGYNWSVRVVKPVGLAGYLS